MSLLLGGFGGPFGAGEGVAFGVPLGGLGGGRLEGMLEVLTGGTLGGFGGTVVGLAGVLRDFSATAVALFWGEDGGALGACGAMPVGSVRAAEGEALEVGGVGLGVFDTGAACGCGIALAG